MFFEFDRSVQEPSEFLSARDKSEFEYNAAGFREAVSQLPSKLAIVSPDAFKEWYKDSPFFKEANSIKDFIVTLIPGAGKFKNYAIVISKIDLDDDTANISLAASNSEGVAIDPCDEITMIAEAYTRACIFKANFEHLNAE